MAGIGNGMPDILYEDSELLVVRKPAGVESQRGKSFAMDLESRLRGYLASSSGKDLPYLAVVHRLDRPVAGVMVYARSKRAAAHLSSQLRQEMFSKVYEAVVCAKPSACEGRLEDWLVSDGRTGMTAVVQKPSAGAFGKSGRQEAKKAILTWQELSREELLASQVLQPFLEQIPKGQERTCLRIRLETGRHHQIRAQLSHAGMPIAGDTRYGGEAAAGPVRGAIALCAAELSFRHPVTGKYLTFCWNDDTNIAAGR